MDQRSFFIGVEGIFYEKESRDERQKDFLVCI